MVGLMPNDIPTFTKKCINNRLATEYEKNLLNFLVCFSALIIILIIRVRYIIIIMELPIKPHSSPTVLKI